MSTEIGCLCGEGNGNTGLPSDCLNIFGVTKGLALQNILNAGVENRIDLSVASLGTTFSSLFSSETPAERLYPIKDLDNVLFPDEGTQYETGSSGRKYELREGITSFTGEVPDTPPQYAAKLNKAKCNRNGVFSFGVSAVQGVRKLDATDGKYYFYPIEINTFKADYMRGTDAKVQHTAIGFEFDQTVNDGELWSISYADLGITYTEMMGLLDINYSIIDAAALTGVGIRLNTDYGLGLDNTTTQNVDGLVTADFTAINQGTLISVSALAVTEVPGNKYTFSWTAESSGQTIRIKVLTATGYDGYIDVVTP